MSNISQRNYNARWYDAALGRLCEASLWDAQADSIVPPGVQGLDRYAYVNNSPMNYVDPSGHICVESDGDSDAGMAGNCHGGSNSKYKPGLQGPKWQKGERDWDMDDWEHYQETAAQCSEIPLLCSSSASGDFPIDQFNQNSTSNENVERILSFWKEFGSPLMQYIDLDQMYMATQRGGWKAIKWSIPTGPIEALAYGFEQGYRDSSRQDIDIMQKGGRVIVSGIEGFLIDGATGLAGAAGFEVLGPLGYVFGSVSVSIAGEEFIQNEVNPRIFPQFGLGNY